MAERATHSLNLLNPGDLQKYIAQRAINQARIENTPEKERIPLKLLIITPVVAFVLVTLISYTANNYREMSVERNYLPGHQPNDRLINNNSSPAVPKELVSQR